MAFLLLSCAVASASAGEPGRVTELMTKALVNVPGKEVTMITVDCAPGAKDPVHRHYASAFVYVLEGAIVMQMKGGKEVTLHPGQTFYEDPKGIHLVGPERQRHQAGKIPGAPRQGEGRAILVPVTE